MSVQEVWILIHLLINTWTDIRTRQISLLSVIVLGTAGIFIFGKSRTAMDIGISICTGAIFLVFSIVNDHSVGAGDGLFVIALGFNMSWYMFLDILVWALIFCFFCAAVMMTLKRKRENHSLPFIPFLLAADLFIKWQESFYAV